VTTSDSIRSTSLPKIAGTVLALVVLLNLHRYIGINHDAALYLGQALLERWPAIFSQDLFFAHGSQGSYTLLPWLISMAFDVANPGTVFLIGSLLGLLAFAMACWFFISGLLPPQQRYWAFLGALCLPSAYGVVRIFSYAEPFLTPRPLAEAFCLLGLGLLARKRLTLGVLCAFAAGVLHPLQAIAACLVAWPWLILNDRRWLHAAWLAIPIALLGLSNLRPFAELFHPIDPHWLQVLREVTGQLFISGWHAADFSVLGVDVLLLVYAWRALPGGFGPWCLSALFGLALGFGLNAILVDWLHLTLPAQLQLWRVHWIAHLLAMASVAALLYRDFKAGEFARGLCLGLGLLLAQSTVWIWPLFALLYALWPRLFGNSSSRIKPLLGTLFLLGMLALLGLYAANEWLLFRMAHYRLDLYAIDRRLLIFPLLALGLPLLGIWMWERSSAWARWLLLCGVLTPLLAIGAARWDARSPMALAVESGRLHANLFGPEIPRDAQVFWVSDLYPSVWLVLHRAEYFSVRQMAGVVFNRGTAMEANHRLDRITLAIREDLYCKSLPLAKREQCQLDDDAMRTACQPGPTRRPDYMVLPYRQPQHPLGHWDFIDPVTGQSAVTYWLYSCDQVMRELDPGVRTDAR